MTKSFVSKIFLNQADAVAVALSVMKSKGTIQYECLPGGQVRITVDQEGAALLHEKLAPSYVYVQEGGSTLELYLHEYETELEALAGRVDCASAGAYRTGAVVEIARVCEHWDGFFYETAEALIGTASDLTFYRTMTS